MKYEIKKVDIWSVARFAGIFYGVIGLIPMFFGLAAFFVSRQSFGWQFFSVALFPLGLFVAGFAVGLIFGFIYNFAAGEIGGIKLDIEYKEENK